MAEVTIKTATDVANLGLGLAGIERILSIDDEGNIPKTCATMLPVSKREVLEQFPWSCALTRVKLAEDATPPAFGWSKSFTLPNDCMRPWFVNGYRLPHPRFVHEQGKIMSNEGPIEVLYVRDIPYAFMPETLKIAIAAAMVANGARALGMSEKSAAYAFEIYDLKLGVAVEADKGGGALEVARGVDQLANYRNGLDNEGFEQTKVNIVGG